MKWQVSVGFSDLGMTANSICNTIFEIYIRQFWKQLKKHEQSNKLMESLTIIKIVVHGVIITSTVFLYSNAIASVSFSQVSFITTVTNYLLYVRLMFSLYLIFCWTRHTYFIYLTHWMLVLPSYRNQSIDLQHWQHWHLMN